MNHEEYLKRRDELLHIRMDSLCSFDKAILTLATGSLALSVAFLEKIGEPFNAATFGLILMVWGSFFLVILLNLGSYCSAWMNMDRKILELDTRYRKEVATGQTDDSPEAIYWQRRATSICNIGAFVLFCLGVLFFIIYIVNIQARNYRELESAPRKESTMPDGKQNLNEGKTEVAKAVGQPIQKAVMPSDRINTYGATEVPQAVVRPTKPNQAPLGGSGKPEK